MKNRIKLFFSSLSLKSRLVAPLVLLTGVVLVTSGGLFIEQRRISNFQSATVKSYQKSSSLEELLGDVIASETSTVSQVWAAAYNYEKNNPITDKWVFDDIQGGLNKLEASLKRHKEFSHNDSEQIEINGKLFESYETLKGQIEAITGMLQAGKAPRAQLFDSLGQIRDTGSRFQDLSTGLLVNVRSKAIQASEEKTSQFTYLLHMAELNLVIQVVLAIILSFVAFVSATKVGSIIKNLIDSLCNELAIVIEKTNQLDEESANLRNSAAEISSASENLSQATTEQSSSLQETASSLEEITSMIKMSGENASNSINLASSSLDVALDGQKAITVLRQAMTEIDQSNTDVLKQVMDGNREITEIVRMIHEIREKTKVIDDIVFQTKLLSFNASVEAARAGNEGKGFAVVAEEVGNLAQMSGAAANEIAEMLNGSIHRAETIVNDTKQKVERIISESGNKVASGSKIAQECDEILGAIVKKAEDMSNMIKEIATASKEQTAGVLEISKAMGQLDQITHENAATSQKTSESSHGLLSQAGGLLKIVAGLQESVRKSDESYTIIKDYIAGKTQQSGSTQKSKTSLNSNHLNITEENQILL